MEAIGSEDGDPSKQSKREEPEQRQKSSGLRNPSHPKRISKRSLSRIQQAIELEKQAHE